MGTQGPWAARPKYPPYLPHPVTPSSGLLCDRGANVPQGVLWASAPDVQSGWNALPCLHSVFKTPSKGTSQSGFGQGQCSEALVLQSQAQNPVHWVEKPLSGLRAQHPEITGLQRLPFIVHPTLAWRRGAPGHAPLCCHPPGTEGPGTSAPRHQDPPAPLSPLPLPPGASSLPPGF